MTLDTVVRIASMTKAITGACAMQLVEQDKLDLDTPLGPLLPDLGRVQVFEGFDAAGEPNCAGARSGRSRCWYLLTHTSGHVYDTWNAKITPIAEKAGIPSTDSGLNAALLTPLMFDPGDEWEYSIGIDWAGKAVEAVSGLTLGQYMKQNIFDPLGMADTGFAIGEPQRTRLAGIHARGESGLVPLDRKYPDKPEYEAGGGGLASTVSDYLTFTQMILHGGTFRGAQILKPETVALMSQNAMGDLNVRALKAAQRQRSNDVDFIDGMKWGLTFLINPQPMAERPLRQFARLGGVDELLLLDRPDAEGDRRIRDDNLPFCDVKALPLFQQFETAIYKAL